MPEISKNEILKKIDDCINIISHKERSTSAEHMAEHILKESRNYILNFSKPANPDDMKDKYRLYTVYLEIIHKLTQRFSKESMYVFSVLASCFLCELSKSYDTFLLPTYIHIFSETADNLLEAIEDEENEESEDDNDI